jgi:O-succinylbenzoic acid--CoA ligase
LDATLAAASASARRLGGTGRWFVPLSTGYIAGLNAAVRSILAGHDPVALPATSGPFSAETFVKAWRADFDPPARFVSLVPTQLTRLVEAAANPGATDLRNCLTSFEAILVGGAACDPALLDAARRIGARVVATYGMAETCGGIVYDGFPLDGVDVRINADGRIATAGPTLAQGYITPAHPTNPPAPGSPHANSRAPEPPPTNPTTAAGGTSQPDHHAPAHFEPLDCFTAEGKRWFTSRDLGSLDASGKLTVHGRADDVIVCGGVKLAPSPIEQALRAHPAVADAVVVPLPDKEWGQIPAALIELTQPASTHTTPPPGELRQLVEERLGRFAVPRRIITVPALPRLPFGKVDRAAALKLVPTSSPAGPGGLPG